MLNFLKSIIRRNSFAKAQVDFERKVSNSLTYATKAGHKVQSKGEKKIADRLYDCNISYSYSTTIEVRGKWYNVDFIPKLKETIVIEFKGMDTPEYNRKFQTKVDALTSIGIPVLVFDPSNLHKVDQTIV